MQYRLSTLFFIFFLVAASLALFGAWGIYIAVVLSIAALCLNHSKTIRRGIIRASLAVFIGIICAGLLIAAVRSAREAARRIAYFNNLKQVTAYMVNYYNMPIEAALLNYYDANKHFPPVYTCDKNGNRLFSWRVEILPFMKYGNIYNALKKDEPWNSPSNAKILSIIFPEFICRSTIHEINDFSTNYVAIIGPGTAWREDGPVKLSDLPDEGKHTVMVVEVVNSGVHWAEPRDLTVEEALQGLKTGKGLRISTAHPSVINVLFADGTVHMLPAKMPISVWKKLLAGEIQDLDNIEDQIDPTALDMVNVSIGPIDRSPGKWTIILGILGMLIWLFSIVLLFHRAIKSRPKPVKIDVANDAVG